VVANRLLEGPWVAERERLRDAHGQRPFTSGLRLDLEVENLDAHVFAVGARILVCAADLFAGGPAA